MSCNKFPDWFPENCPPADAFCEKLKVYRLAFNKKLKKKDFLPNVKLYPKNKRYKNNILAYGISVFEDIQDMKDMKRKIPGLKKMKYNIVGYTIEEYGLIKHTPNNNSHITWWLYEDMYPINHFKLVKEGEENE